MGQFITLMNLKIAHSYYRQPIAGHFALSPTEETRQLMYNRSVSFARQADGWTWMVEEDCAGFMEEDVLELSLQALDTKFVLITRLEGYQPQNFYRLMLGSEREVDVASAWEVTDERKWKSELCRICIKLTPEMLEEARGKQPRVYTLRFGVMAYRWEYLFVVRNEHQERLQRLALEEAKGRVAFGEAERLEEEAGGEMRWRILSTEPVEMRERQEYILTLSELLSDNPLKKRIVSRFIPCPQPGKYHTDEAGIIRQICYL